VPEPASRGAGRGGGRGYQPGEAYVREGRYAQAMALDVPSGQGSDLAGTVRASGPGWTPSRSATRCSGGPTPARARRSTWSCRWARSSQAAGAGVGAGRGVARRRGHGLGRRACRGRPAAR
jgi:hypothetical protein